MPDKKYKKSKKGKPMEHMMPDGTMMADMDMKKKKMTAADMKKMMKDKAKK